MKLRILIADDEELERRALHRIFSTLDGQDLELIEAANGRQAVELVSESPVDLAFLDIRMPGMDGLQAARELKRLCPDIHVVFLTAFSQFDYAREAIRMGVDEYLVKPASPEEIYSTVSRMIGRIEDKRLTKSEGIRNSRENEQVLALLGEELSSDLGKSDMDSRRLFSFFNLNGLENFGLLSLIIRLNKCETDDWSDRKLILAQNADLAETCFAGAGWRFLLETGDSELCCAAAITSDGSGTDGIVPATVNITLEQLVDKLLPNHNAFIGACFLPQPESFTPFLAARDALALARREKPVVLLAPGVAEANGVGINRHGAATVERALAYMHAHLAENLSLADVAAVVGSAPSHLSRLFSRQGGETFVHVFHRLRIAAARDLLRSGLYRVKEVCTMVGFRDQAYFSRVFRKYEGTNPASYWKRSGS